MRSVRDIGAKGMHGGRMIMAEGGSRPGAAGRYRSHNLFRRRLGSAVKIQPAQNPAGRSPSAR